MYWNLAKKLLGNEEQERARAISTEGMKEKVVSRMYATHTLTWYSNRRVQHGKLHGSKIHHFPRRASRRPQSSKSIDILPKVTKLQPRERAAGRSASLRGRQTAKLSYDASGQGSKEGRKCRASATCRNRIIRRRRAAASTQPTLLFPRRSLRGEGRRPEFLPRCLSRLPIWPIEIVFADVRAFTPRDTVMAPFDGV